MSNEKLYYAIPADGKFVEISTAKHNDVRTISKIRSSIPVELVVDEANR